MPNLERGLIQSPVKLLDAPSDNKGGAGGSPVAEVSTGKKISRRDFLNLAWWTAGGLLAGCIPASAATQESTQIPLDPTPRPAPTTQPSSTPEAEPTDTPTSEPTADPKKTEASFRFNPESWEIRKRGQALTDFALTPLKFALDIQYGPLAVAFLQGEDLTNLDNESLSEKRIKLCQNLEGTQGERCKRQIGGMFDNLRNQLKTNDLSYKNMKIAVDQDREGNFYVSHLIFDQIFRKRYFRVFIEGESFHDFHVNPTSFYNMREGDIYELLPNNLVPMFPELENISPFFQFTSPYNRPDLLPIPRKESKIVILPQDSTGTFNGPVFPTEISGPKPDGDNHRSFFSGGGIFSNPTSLIPVTDELEGKNEGKWKGRVMPFEFESSAYFNNIDQDAGKEVNRRGGETAGVPNDIWALMGDVHVAYPDNTEGQYEEDRVSWNTILSQINSKWFIIPAAHNNPSRQFRIGQHTDLKYPLQLNQWLELKTIADDRGIWTMWRHKGENRYRAMGYVKQENPGKVATDINWGPYATYKIDRFSALWRDFTFRSKSPSVILAPMNS